MGFYVGPAPEKVYDGRRWIIDSSTGAMILSPSNESSTSRDSRIVDFKKTIQ